MPKGKGYKGKNAGSQDNSKKQKNIKPQKKGDTPFSELSKEEQLKRARAARKRADEVQEGSATKFRSNVRSERAGAFKAQKAAERVEARLTGKQPAGIKRGTPRSFASAAQSLLDLGKKGAALPGKLAAGLESARESSEAGSNRKKKGIRVP